ncbi:MAG TPA: anthranilate synthase component I family protein [Flavobacteriales bacterium]
MPNTLKSALVRPWNGELYWPALAPQLNFLARRIPSPDRWVIAVALPGARRLSMEQALDGGGWAFGHVAYEWSGGVEHATGRHPDTLGFGDHGWWEPQVVIELGQEQAVLHTSPAHMAEGTALLETFVMQHTPPSAPIEAAWERTTSRDRYRAGVGRLMGHIQRGDIYEVNYCTERHAHLPGFDPFRAFAALSERSAAPYAGFYRVGPLFALCASPERYLQWAGQRVLSEPMKGTRPRDPDPVRDAELAAVLAADPKERSENVMALDVARHDLSRIAASGSVKVEELCGVRSYPAVHQMVSSVSATKRNDVTWHQVLRATFPMASMTGAPKRRAMQLIDEVEDGRRGLFSGTLGLVWPDGRADLNVVIRTLMYDADSGRASLISGGAITAASDPLAEWEECELKARSVIQALGHAE